MIRRIYGIASIAVREAARSRLLLLMAAVMAVILFGLPMTIKGDGTLPGQVKILLSYALGLTSIVLGIMSLWTSCASVSQEIEEKQVQVLAVKPVRKIEVWLGKWIGLLFLNAVLLGFAGVAVWGSVTLKSRSDRYPEGERKTVKDEILSGRRLIIPRDEGTEKEALRRFDEMKKSGQLQKDAAPAGILRTLYSMVKVESLTVAPGRMREWTFDIPESYRNNSRLMLRYRFFSHSRDRKPVTGTWTIKMAEKAEKFSITQPSTMDGVNKCSIPSGLVEPGKQMVISFSNAEESESDTVIFKTDGGIELLLTEGSFAANLVTSLFIIFCYMALLSALGLTMGSIFTFPVAVFSGASVVMIAILASTFAPSAGPSFLSGVEGQDYQEQSGAARTFNAFGEKMADVIHVAVSPAIRQGPLERLSDGIKITADEAAKDFLVLVVVYAGLLGAVGGLVLSKRELAMPV